MHSVNTESAPPYDLVVIGGGIHGAGVAQAAQAAGYRTALIEKRHPAAGTSSKSSKLIHGGLRYLETGQFSLVWHSLRERQILLDIAPELVTPLRFNIPVYPNTSRRPWQLRIGLSLYALFAGFTALARFRTLSAAQCKALPGLKKTNLQTVFSYWDAQTDDALLTRAVVQSAIALGVDWRSPAAVSSVISKVGQKGGEFGICLNGDDQPALYAGLIINAAGPWANEVLGCFDQPPSALPIDWVKGSHLILDESISAEAFYLEAEDGRAVFALPWGDQTLLGTTEQIHTGDPETVSVSAEEREYLLKTLKHYFPHCQARVVEEFAGLRVLPAATDKPFLRARDCTYYVDPGQPNVMTLYGGKLTSYRHTAEKAVKWIRSRIGRRQAVADTRTLHLDRPGAGN